MDTPPIRGIAAQNPLVRTARTRKDPQQGRSFAENFDAQEDAPKQDEAEAQQEESPLQRILQARAARRRQKLHDGEHQLDVMA